MYIDTHCHLEDEKFVDVDRIIEEFTLLGVNKVINMGCDEKTSILSKNLANNYENLYYAVGFHPEFVEDFNVDKISVLERLANDIKCVAIGEIGLDYHYEQNNKEKQIDCFIKQIELAYKLKLPVSIHSRDATKDTLDVLKQLKNKLVYGGVMHCFSGSVETANEYVKMGLKIGFGGTITFKNAKNVVEVAKAIPQEFILTETDSPYLAPEPFRGTLNTPKNIPQIVGKLALIRDVSPSKMAEIVMKNATELFYKIK